MSKRFSGDPLCTIKSHFVTISSRVLQGIIKETSPEFNVNR